MRQFGALIGGVDVTGFDADERADRDRAMKWGIMFTPPLMFFPKTAGDSLPSSAEEVVQRPGACGVDTAGSF